MATQVKKGGGGIRREERREGKGEIDSHLDTAHTLVMISYNWYRAI